MIDDSRIPDPPDTLPAPPVESSEKRKRGFAAMPSEWVKAQAKKGGVQAQKGGKAHRFQVGKEARDAGRKGGKACMGKRRKPRVPVPQESGIAVSE